MQPDGKLRLFVKGISLRCQPEVAEEFQNFLRILLAPWGLTMESASPIDVIMFSETVWAHQHKGSRLPDGSRVASPSRHNSMLSMLSTLLIQLGRCGPWDNATGQGNPIL